MKRRTDIERGMDAIVRTESIDFAPWRSMHVINTDWLRGTVTGSAGQHVRIRCFPRLVRHVLLSERGITWAAGRREIDALLAQEALLR